MYFIEVNNYTFKVNTQCHLVQAYGTTEAATYIRRTTSSGPRLSTSTKYTDVKPYKKETRKKMVRESGEKKIGWYMNRDAN